MNKELKSHYVDEVKYQTKMLNNLKRWLKCSIIFSSLFLAFILFVPASIILRIIGIIGMVLCVIASVVIGLGIRNGRNNVNKILDLIQ